MQETTLFYRGKLKFDAIYQRLCHSMKRCLEKSTLAWRVCIQHSKRNKRKTALIGASMLSLTLIGIYGFNSHTKAQHIAENDVNTTIANRKQTQILEGIDALKQQLQDVNLKAQSNEHDSSALEQQIQQMNQQLATLADNANFDQVNTLIENNNASFNEKIADLKNAIGHLMKQATPTRYDAPDHLPFRVVSLDVWNGRTLATIAMGHHEALIGEGESQAGWKAIRFDFMTNTAVFINPDGVTVCWPNKTACHGERA